jgi:hypothetical protein
MILKSRIHAIHTHHGHAINCVIKDSEHNGDHGMVENQVILFNFTQWRDGCSIRGLLWTMFRACGVDRRRSNTNLNALPALAGDGGGRETLHLSHMSMDSLPVSRD